MTNHDIVAIGASAGGHRALALVATPPAALTCPECRGMLWQVKNDDLVRYRCHGGHAFSLDELSASKKEELERALYVALRTPQERGSPLMSQHWRRRIDEYEEQAQAIRIS